LKRSGNCGRIVKTPQPRNGFERKIIQKMIFPSELAEKSLQELYRSAIGALREER
jgi:hypothetical protein